MGKIMVVPLPGGAAKVSIQTREHCPPHATCRDLGGRWVVRISFSFAYPTLVGLLDVRPRKTILELRQSARWRLRYNKICTNVAIGGGPINETIR
jgi:hypothetical protein